MANKDVTSQFSPGGTGLTDAEGKVYPVPGRESEIHELIREFFDPQLDMIGLTIEKIYEQSLPVLHRSLDIINDAISKPESFGTLALGVDTDGNLFISQGKTDDNIHEIGILPILLERKILISERINSLGQPKDADANDTLPPVNVSAIGPSIDIVAWIKYLKGKIVHFKQ